MNGMSAKTRYLRQSPRKVRLVANMIRGLAVSNALVQLAHIAKASARPLAKTLHSAIANAENNFHKQRDTLFIKELRVDEGPDMRRWRPRAFGRAAPILKHSCHITIILGEKEGTSLPAQVPEKTKEQKESLSEPVLSAEHSFEPAGNEIHPVQSTEWRPEIVDPSRAGKHETAQSANIKEKKKSKGFIKRIIQRKTG